MSSEPSKLPATEPGQGQPWAIQQLKHWIFNLYDRAPDVIVIGLVFVMQVLIKLYDKQAPLEMLAGLAGIIFVPVVARTLTARYSPVRGERR